MNHVPLDELNAGLGHIRQSPQDRGVLEGIVIRPTANERKWLSECELSPERGVHGDGWADGCWMSLPDGRPHPDVQVTMINARVAQLLAGEKERWRLAGDNLYVDLDLSPANLSCGQQLDVGEVRLEITGVPHTGCRKFSQRYGPDAVKFVHSPPGKELRLRGVYARIIRRGRVRVGDALVKVDP